MSDEGNAKPERFRSIDLVTVWAAKLWRLAGAAIYAVFSVIAALFILFEEWGWQPLSNLLARLARFKIWAQLELWVAGLPPYGALALFVMPSLLLFPLKLFALYLLAGGYVVSAGFLLAGAKIASTAFVARVFLLTQPQLMRIAWFAWAYDRFMPWKVALFARVRASFVWRMSRVVKARASKAVSKVLQALKPVLHGIWFETKSIVRRFTMGAVILIKSLR